MPAKRWRPRIAVCEPFLRRLPNGLDTRVRGGGAAHLSLDWETADTKFQVAATGEIPGEQGEEARLRSWIDARRAPPDDIL